MKKAILAIVLCGSMLVPIFASCDIGTAPDTNGESTQETRPDESEKESDSKQENGEKDYLFANKKMNYRIVYPADADVDVVNAANLLYTKVYNYVSDKSFFGDDATVKDEAGVEILIGETNREESRTLSSEIGDNAYAIKRINGNIVVCASKNWMLQDAVEELMEKIEFAKDRSNAVIDKDIDSVNPYDGMKRQRWGIDIPAYEGGILGAKPYIYNYGLDTIGGTSPKNYSVVCATKTNGAEFSQYIAKLEKAGFALEKIADNEGILSYWVSKDNSRVMYMYLSKKVGEARFVLDKGESDTDFSYIYEKKAGDTTALYQYGFVMSEHGKNVNEYYRDENGNKIQNNKTSNCGQLLVFKLADNSVMIIDGASRHMMPETAMAGLNSFLHEITGTPEGETVRISNWMITHSHEDHFGGFAKFLVKYHEYYNIERASFNFNYKDSDMPTFFKEYFNKWYPDAKYYRPHTGETINIADITIDILYTYEDHISAETGDIILDKTPILWGGTPKVDQNNSSITAKITFDGKTFLLTGDIATAASDILLANYSDSTLKADILQVSHHGLNPLPTLYEKVAPSISIYSQNPTVAQGTNISALAPSVYNSVVSVTKGGLENVYFQTESTVGISVNADGEFVITERDVIGDVWDGKDIYGNPVTVA